MKIPVCSMLSIFCLLFLSTFSSAAIHPSNSAQDFVKCLIRSSSSSISQVIYTSQNSTYTSVLKFSINNLRFDTPSTPKPIVIVKPVHESQIQTVIYCCKKHDIQMRIRGGGHDYEGVSYVAHVPFMLLDMINLRSIKVDPVKATAWVEAGATLGELYYRISEKSDTLGFPAGIWSTVGVSGLVSGGGYGTLRRKYGLAADNVLDARLIDANGRILDRKSMGEDLFWAIRGGGASSFGVILSWKLRLVYVPKIITVFQVTRTLEQNATEVLHRWQTVAPRLPKDVELRIAANTIWKNLPNEPQKTVQDDGSAGSVGDNKTVSVNFIGQYLGRKERLLSMMNKRFPELGLVADSCFEVSYIQSILVFSLFSLTDSPLGLLNRTAYKIPFKAKSDYVDKPIPKEGLEGIWKILLEQDPGRINFLLTSYGGKMAEISESAIPFPHRAGTLYMMYMRVRTDGDTSDSMKWIRGLHKYLTPYVTNSPRTAYRNYNDFDLGVNNPHGPTSYKQASKWGRKYFKNNFNRLVKVKSIVDPHNFFRHEQSIPPFA
ncbi:berberine bridge enzyme-like 8 [Heracleum sosnowskyi]|uniref:Berberine bridge enzyme-like 8 n=1 Tax=Heracleum sosnowskyi TaxID=360622 RepID=A0AAD8I5U8_9APIA|nr:berberine bridge enzyme-like 8 [Heracleum sosnowskyi]